MTFPAPRSGASPSGASAGPTLSGNGRHTTVAATPDSFLTQAAGAAVVHFAGHAIVNDERPDLSCLVLSPKAGDSGSGLLFASRISSRAWPTTRLVVLAACGTASGAAYRGEGVMSLARPFLGAGVKPPAECFRGAGCKPPHPPAPSPTEGRGGAGARRGSVVPVSP